MKRMNIKYIKFTCVLGPVINTLLLSTTGRCYGDSLGFYRYLLFKCPYCMFNDILIVTKGCTVYIVVSAIPYSGIEAWVIYLQ